MGNVLAFMEAEDQHDRFVTPFLNQQGVNLTRIELEGIPKGSPLTYKQDERGSTASFKGLELVDVSAVWWRQPMRWIPYYTPLDRLPEYMHEFANLSVTRHAQPMAAWFDNARWISDPYRMIRADNKAYQLKVAHESGLCVPRTLQTSDPAEAASFIVKEHAREGCIVKHCAETAPENENGERLIFWTTKIEPGHPLEGWLTTFPLIFQQRIPGEDLRVIAVGDELFAAKITRHLDASYKGPIDDWRAVDRVIEGSLGIESYELQPETAEGCRRFIRRLGLKFGAIDMKLDADGNEVFLENNVTGAFDFIMEATTDLPIGAAIANQLMGRV